MRKTRTIVTGVALAAAFSLAACTGGSGASSTSSASSSAGGTTEISFQTWSLKNDRFTPYFEQLVKDFEAENPDIKVKWIDQPGDGYEDKILQQANSGELPDVLNLPPGFAYKLADTGLLVDLDKVEGAKVSEYVESAAKAYQFPGIEGHYGYPWYLGTDLNWYNVGKMKEVGIDTSKLPTTLDELFSMASNVAKASNGEVKMISSVPDIGTFSAAGIDIYKDGKFVFNTDEAAKIIDQFQKAYKDGAMPAEALNADYQGNAALYKQGKSTWTTGSAGFASALKADAPSLIDQTEVTPRIGHAPVFIQGISVAKNSKNQAAAVKFAQYVTNTKNQVEFVKIAQGFFPGTKAGNEKPEAFTSVVSLDLQKKATELAAKELPNTVEQSPLQFTDEMGTYVKQQLALAVKGEISSKDALEKAVKYCNDNLAK